MHKRPIHNVLTVLGMLGVLLLGLWLYEEVAGSERTKQRAITAAESYVKTTYPELELDYQSTMYLFPYGSYYSVKFSSPNSVDTILFVAVSKSGDIINDSYEEVMSGETTYQRLNASYEERTKQLFKSDRFPIPLDYARATILRDGDSPDVPGVVLEHLTFDDEFDLPRYSADYGQLYLSLPDDTYSPNDAPALFRSIRAFFDEENLPFHSISLSATVGETVYNVNDVLYEEIASDNLSNIIRARTISLL